MNSKLKGACEQLSWAEVRQDVKKVNPEFARLIDEVNPGKKHWLLKAKYPFGSRVMERSILTLPNTDGDIVPITDSTIPAAIRDGIGYNLNSNPVSLVLKNSFEIYLPLDDRTVPLSGVVGPGVAFGSWRVLNPSATEQPVFLWDMTAGARSVFMLPKITEAAKHKKLQKEFSIGASKPDSLMQHWEVFRELANSPQLSSQPWEAEILYFNEEWFKHLDDSAWSNFYQYFHHTGWAAHEFWRNQPIWNLIFSLILKDYQARPNAYIMDTAKYLLNLGAGALPGIGPVKDTSAGPFDVIQDIYTNVYELKNYPPIIMQPQIFDLKNSQGDPVYYSLRFPNAIEFKPSSRKKTSIVSDLHEIIMLMRRYKEELLSNKFNIGGTSLRTLFDVMHYDYFHSDVELHDGMRDSAEMAADKNLRTTLDGVLHDEFPSKCLFGKGCIRLSHKDI